MPNADPVDEVIDSLDEATRLGAAPARTSGRSSLKAGARIAAEDAQADARLPAPFGGDGQLQQLIVHDINGHHVAVGDIVEVNQGWTRCR